MSKCDNPINLPEGWVRVVKTRRTGKTAGKSDVLVYSPEGDEFRSGKELERYFIATNSTYDYKEFGFFTKPKHGVMKMKTNPIEKKKLSTEKKRDVGLQQKSIVTDARREAVPRTRGTSRIKPLVLELASPAGTKPAVYHWPLVTGTGEAKRDRSAEIVETIKLVAKELLPDMQPSLNEILDDYDSTSYEKMKMLVDKYNQALSKFLLLENRNRRTERLNSRASREHLRFILNTVYHEAITDANELRDYPAFSSSVYGETSYNLVCQIIDAVQMSEEDTFIDLGSGVGQVVLQIAASTPCKMVLGIERAECPSRYAKDMDRLFKKWMQWWGKSYEKYKLVKGNFVDSKHEGNIHSSNIIYVNNAAFEPELDDQLIERFISSSRNGAMIISTKTLCPRPSPSINDRNQSALIAIGNVRELCSGPVSWTSTQKTLFLLTIDHFKAAKILAEQRRTNGKRSKQDE